MALTKIDPALLAAIVSNLTEDTSPDSVADFLLSYDASAGAFKKVKPYNIAGILQVQSTAKTDSFGTASTSFTDITGFSVSITPKSTSSKVLVIAMVTVGHTATADAAQLNLLRDSTEIFKGDASASHPRMSAFTMPLNSHNHIPLVLVFQDSPATTSATTYKVQIKTKQGSVLVNRSGTDPNDADGPRTPSSITVIEVKG